MQNLIQKWKNRWFTSSVYHFEENFNPELKEKLKKNKQTKTPLSREEIKEIKENIFSVDTPPPTVSGTLHIGHVFSYSHADFIARYNRMRGKDVFYPIGFDDNGLPTERLVEKIKKIRGIDYFKAGKKAEFIKECESVIEQSEKDFEKLFQDLGYSFDWSKKYQTISNETQKIAHASFLDLYSKGLIYFSNKPTYWDCEDQTAIAQTEIEDCERDAKEYYLKFYFEDQQFLFDGKNYLEIMTTRPELLCNCFAVFINPEDSRAATIVGKKLKVPFFDNLVTILNDEDVALEKGTGLVMCCAFGNMQDYTWIKRHNLQKEKIKEVISKDGKIINDFFKFTKENGDADYLRIKKAQEKIVHKLTEENLLIAEKTKDCKQIVKIAERSKTALEILGTNQCYLKLLDFKEDFLFLAENYLDFYPQHLKNRLIQWIEGINQDWCISRNRFMGINPPKLEKIKEYSSKKITDEISDENLNFVFDTWFTSSVSPQINSRFISENFYDSDFLEKNPNFNDLVYPFSIRPQAHEIIRTWTFTTLAKAHLHGLSNLELKEKLEAIKEENKAHLDKKQASKNWFSKFTQEEIISRFIPWQNVVLSGWCLAEDKTKMSKSKGNILDPVILLEQKSPDAIRYWAASSSLGTDTPFNSEKVESGKKLINKISNAFRFISMQIENSIQSGVQTNATGFAFNHNNFDFINFTKVSKNYLFDQYYIAKFTQILKDYEAFMDKFEFAKAKDLIEDFFWKDFCDNYLEIAKTRSYGLSALIYKDKKLNEKQKEEILNSQQSALMTLKYLFDGILKLFAPFMPFITEEVNEEILIKHNKIWTAEQSIHRKGNWLKDHFFQISKEENSECLFALEILDFIRKEKSKNNLSIKAEIKQMTIAKKINPKLIDDLAAVASISPNAKILVANENSIEL
jgi:valyl-tRNA synthetase